jgi:hypothetical protein
MKHFNLDGWKLEEAGALEKLWELILNEIGIKILNILSFLGFPGDF